jgi:oligopeptide/dipeptide ABC transporter ATP-binding protein
MPEPLVEVTGLTRRFEMPGSFGRKPVGMLAVNDVSFSILRGETVGVVGESGCGKSTMARLVLRLIQSTAGRIVFDGVDFTALDGRGVRQARRRMAMVFQDPYSSLDPRFTLADVLSEPFRAQGLKVPPGRTDELLEAVGLSARLRSVLPHQLSGGQRQRVGVARALALSPQFIVFDEPTASLDVSIQAQIVELLLRLRAERALTYMFISHDLGLVSYLCDRILVMYFGRIVEVLPAPTAPARHPYTRALLDSSFVPDPEKRRVLAPIVGEPPSVYDPPPGCAFAARCDRCDAACRTERPVLRSDDAGGAFACHHPIL